MTSPIDYEEREIVTAQQLATALGVSEKTVHRWITTRGVPTLKPLGDTRREYLIDLAEFVAWLRDNRYVLRTCHMRRAISERGEALIQGYMAKGFEPR